MTSISQKISFGFYAFVATVALLAALAYSNLRYLEWRIGSGTAIADFLGAVLELRRYEKNYFLYGTPSDLETAATFLDEARAILRERQRAFSALGGDTTVAELGGLLDRYQATLSGYESSPPRTEAERARLRDVVRDLGHSLADSAEDLARVERTELADAAQSAQGVLLGAVMLVVLLGVVAARVLSRTAVRPMVWLESKLAAIGEGSFNQVEPVSRDQEIVSMSRAVNRMMSEIEARNRELAQSEKLASLGTLVSGVAHELNNPLSNISSTCQILMEELGKDGDVDPMTWLQQIDDETERARRIVQTLLEFSRERTFKKQWLPLRPLVEKAVLLLGRSKRNQLELDVAAHLTAFVDAQRFQQVMVNLIRNAEDAGGGEVRIRVTADIVSSTDFRMPEVAVSGRRSSPAHNADRVLVIQVEDDGPGIPEKILPRIFDPFFTTKDVGHGSGLGLYVVHEIVDSHDGCIGVQSTPGQGTRFIVCLPHPTGDWQA